MARKKDTLAVSPKYGVNPSIMHCFICGKETGVSLLGKLKGDKEAPKDVTNPHELCDDCKKQINVGNKFILEVKDNTDENNPERTGRFICIKGEALPDIKSTISYMVQSVFDKIFGEFIK